MSAALMPPEKVARRSEDVDRNERERDANGAAASGTWVALGGVCGVARPVGRARAGGPDRGRVRRPVRAIGRARRLRRHQLGGTLDVLRLAAVALHPAL